MTRKVFLPLLLLAFAGLACGLSDLGGLFARDYAPTSDEQLEGGDLRFKSLSIPAGVTITLADSASITISGPAQIDGELLSSGGSLTLIARDDLTISGRIDIHGQAEPGDSRPGLYLVAEGGLVIGESAAIASSGQIYLLDDPDDLALSPVEIADETDSASGDLPTLVPLPPDDPAFTRLESAWQPAGRAAGLAARPPQALPPIVIGGRWDLSAFPGDQQVVVFRFGGARDLHLQNFRLSGPPAPRGAESQPDSGDAQAKNGKKGMRLNIRNAGGSLTFRNTTLNLTDGGSGGDATANCGNARGGDGGESGNFRASAGQGIKVESLTINPGRGGSGGSATATCDQPGGDARKAEGGKGADNNKRLYARGNVSGLQALTIGPVVAGDGGSAWAEGADGEPGGVCENGQDGGNATAIGGAGGKAALSVRGLPVSGGEVRGGRGGNADAFGGNGGDGGPCPCQLTFGGFGGGADASAGVGGTASGGQPARRGEDGVAFSMIGIDGQDFADVCGEAGLLIDSGDFQGALALLDDYLAENPEAARGYYLRGEALNWMGRPERALAEYDQALALDPTLVDAHVARGWALLNQSALDEAQAAFQRALELDPANADAYLGAGFVAEARHDRQAAAAAYALFLQHTAVEDSWTAHLRQRLEEWGYQAPPISAPIQISASYAHTQPGVESEVYLDVTGPAGTRVEATLAGKGVAGEPLQRGVIGEGGTLRLTWRITRYGEYYAHGKAGGHLFNSEVDVQ